MTRYIRKLLAITLLLRGIQAHYKLVRDFSGLDFVNNFDFYSGPDPTNGHVQYKGAATANATGLTGFLVGPNGTNINNITLSPPVYLGVDFTNVYPNDTGRPSVRVSSVQSFNQSLIVADISHMPSSTCGLWPAFWLLGTSAPWPNAGEIDVLENVNDNDFNIMTLHTSSGLVVANDTTAFDGTLTTSNCNINAPNQDKNAGCSIKDKPESNSYGTNFNKNEGGVFAILYTSEKISIWFFPRDSIPPEILSHGTTISPASFSTWGKPKAVFAPTDSNNDNTTVPAKMTDKPFPPLTPDPTSPSQPPPAPENSIIPVPASVSVSASVSISIKPTIPSLLANTTTPTLSLTDESNTNTNTDSGSDGSNTPNPSSLPTVLTTHFNSLQIIFDTTFCGDWAGKVWNSSTSTCGKLAPTCEEYVSSNPQAFQDAYWAVQSVRVFVDDD